jgi:hypothetical protein
MAHGLYAERTHGTVNDRNDTPEPPPDRGAAPGSATPPSTTDSPGPTTTANRPVTLPSRVDGERIARVLHELDATGGHRDAVAAQLIRDLVDDRRHCAADLYAQGYGAAP